MVLQANTFLAMARTVLDIYGVEGDEGGPLAQLSALTQAMAEE